jgi:hypothetical protein
LVGDLECAGINRHVVGDERALRERRAANPSWPRFTDVTAKVVIYEAFREIVQDLSGQLVCKTIADYRPPEATPETIVAAVH